MSLKELKKRFQHRCFPVDIAKFFWTAILNFICQRLLLDLQKSNRERIESYRSKLESRKVVLTKMSSNKRSGNNLSDENEKGSKKIRCSLTGYSDFCRFLKKIPMQRRLEEVVKNENSIQTMPYKLDFY